MHVSVTCIPLIFLRQAAALQAPSAAPQLDCRGTMLVPNALSLCGMHSACFCGRQLLSMRYQELHSRRVSTPCSYLVPASVACIRFTSVAGSCPVSFICNSAGGLLGAYCDLTGILTGVQLWAGRCNIGCSLSLCLSNDLLRSHCCGLTRADSRQSC